MKAHAPTAKIALMLADVDGALVTRDKVLTPTAKAAVQRLRDLGIAFTITSGRPPRGMKQLMDELAIDTVVAGFNGGVYVNPDLSVVESHFIPQDASRQTLQLIAQHGLVAWLYTDTEWYIPDPKGPHVARETWTVKFDATVSTNFDSLLARAVKIVGVSDDLKTVERCEAVLRTQLRGKVAAARSQPYYLDVTHPDANKGAVVSFLSRKLRIPAEAIATLGDMPNDVMMFKKSGLSIAMGNASKEVQAEADFVTLSNEEDGFAYAMDHFVLSP